MVLTLSSSTVRIGVASHSIAKTINLIDSGYLLLFGGIALTTKLNICRVHLISSSFSQIAIISRHSGPSVLLSEVSVAIDQLVKFASWGVTNVLEVH